MAGAVTWHKVSDVRGFLSSKGQRSVGTHQMALIKRQPWPYCKRCGLLALRNDVTRAALKAACVVEE